MRGGRKTTGEEANSMSEVNADGVLLDPQRHLLQETQHLTNSLMADDPNHLGDTRQTTRSKAGSGQDAGPVGGAPHIPGAALETAKKYEKKAKKKER